MTQENQSLLAWYVSYNPTTKVKAYVKAPSRAAAAERLGGTPERVLNERLCAELDAAALRARVA